MKHLFLLMAFLMVTAPRAGTDTAETALLMAGGREITVEVAATPTARQQGLSDRTHLPDSCGVLFVFPAAAPRSFWMYRCHFDIDIAFITADGTIDEIITMRREPADTPPDRLAKYPSRSPAIQYALEMNGGWFARNGVAPGTTLELSRFKAAR